MRKSFKLPKRINLPGWPINIRLVDQAEIDAKFLGENCADATFDYDDNGAQILILKTLPITQQRLCLAHELQHALVDYLDVLVRSGSAKP
jgi:hypothetical protein